MKGISIYRYANILDCQSVQKVFPFPALVPKSNDITEDFKADDIDFKISHQGNSNELIWSSNKENIKFYNIYKLSGSDKKLSKSLGKVVKKFSIPVTTQNETYALSYTTIYDNESPLFYPSKSALAETKTEHMPDSSIKHEVPENNDPFNINYLFSSSIYLTCYPVYFKEYLLVGYELNQKLPVEVTISSVTGNESVKLLKGIQNEGKYILKADGSDFKKGKYICTLRAGDLIKQKIIIKK